MSKNKIRVIAFAAIALVVFNVIAFVIPIPKSAVFWVAYIFGMLAIAAQLLFMNVAFSGKEDIRSKFYGFPIARIGVIYGACQLLLSFAAMALGAFIPVWVPVVVFVIIAAAAGVGLISTDMVREEIEKQDEKLVKDVSRMRSLQSKMNVLISQTDAGGELKTALDKLADEIKYSDPVSSSATEQIEDELNFNIEELQKAIVDGDNTSALTNCKKTSGILAERNRLCKLNKNSK